MDTFARSIASVCAGARVWVLGGVFLPFSSKLGSVFLEWNFQNIINSLQAKRSVYGLRRLLFMTP